MDRPDELTVHSYNWLPSTTVRNAQPISEGVYPLYVYPLPAIVQNKWACRVVVF